MSETFNQNLLHHHVLAWPGGTHALLAGGLHLGSSCIYQEWERECWDACLAWVGQQVPSKIYLLGSPAPPHSILALAVPVSVGQSCFLSLMSPSVDFCTLQPNWFFFFKHHFAHVTTLLKTNLWGLFCTQTPTSADLVYPLYSHMRFIPAPTQMSSPLSFIFSQLILRCSHILEYALSLPPTPSLFFPFTIYVTWN